MEASEIRKDYFLEKYVIITPMRADRPKELGEETVIKPSIDCPFCSGHIRKEKIVAKMESRNKKTVISIDNIYPALSLKNNKAYGKQEVIIETEEHGSELGDLSEAEIEAVLRMYADRTQALSRNKKIKYILCFKNQGAEAGASIVHAHSQVFASSLLPPDIKESSRRANAYFRKHGICPFCDMIKKENGSLREIFQDGNIQVFSPYASEFHYEAWIVTKRHLDNATRLNDSEYASLARALKRILAKLRMLGLSYNFYIHQAVANRNEHFCLKIQPRGSVWAGVELGSGLIINSVPPEEAAEYYRE